uniref:Odorant receptor n=1 Tax=Scaeva pyrastri TaxID=219539 RepID=A0A1B3B7A7_SCAPY|nr:putative odorant receptor OR27 [Scaeva pyrastri]
MTSSDLSDNLVEVYFRMAKWVLGFIGFWPLDPLNRLTILKIIINLIVLLTAIIGELRFSWIIRDDLLEALDALCPCLTKLVTWLKLVCFLIYRKELAILLNDFLKHIKEDTKDKLKNSMITKVTFLIHIWWMILYFFGISVNCLYVFKPIIIWTYHRFINGINDKWISLPFQAALPYADMTQLDSKFLYSIVYIFLVHSGNVTIFGFPGADGMFMSMCMYISNCYQCLQEDFKKTFKDYSQTEINVKINNIVYGKLSAIVKRQQNVIKMFNSLNHVYKFMIFGHFLFASINMGIVLMNVQLTTGMTKIVNITFVFGACTQLYTYCYGAEHVNTNYLQISETLYFCDWYRYDKRVKSLINFVLLESQRGSLMSVPFFPPSLPLFSSIIQTSGSYFTLLQTFL